MCGEKNPDHCITSAMLGSPPRMRGKEQRFSYTQLQARITPAYAGKSRIRRACTDRHRDHPRMCGEKLKVKFSLLGDLGSPPHVRGKENCVLRRVLRVGITPACAGKS